jgi:CRP/FNR family cyclic AMP-dependent transcriptional regulator
MLSKPSRTAFDLQRFLTKAGQGRTVADYPAGASLFAQGDAADAIFFITKGKICVSVVSNRGKEAIIAILSHGEFFGEGALGSQAKRTSSAKAMVLSSITRVAKAAALRALAGEPSLSKFFLDHLLARSIRMEEDLVDQLFNSSEKRLARVLLLLANFGKEGAPQTEIAHISQETLAEIVGTTRSRISFFMNKFRKLGYISYNNGRVEVHSSLLNVILKD